MTSRSKTTSVDEALRAREHQFQLLVQGVKDYAIFLLDPQGRITTWNSGAERIKGYDADEIIGEHFSRFYTEGDQREGVPMRGLLRAATEGRHEAEGWRVRKDGTRFRASVVIDAIHDDAGKLIGFAKVTRDVTERHLAQEMIEQARERLLQWQKMEAIGQLSGGVAHDFNNLLTIVIGNLETAQRQLGALSGGVASRLKYALDNAMRGAQRAATLTQRLLAFSRQQPLDPKPLDVNKFIAAEVEFLQRSLGETIEVEAVGSAGLWPVEVDTHQLEAALLNLAVNARDAMPNGGKLTIETSNALLDHDYCSANPEVTPGQYVMDRGIRQWNRHDEKRRGPGIRTVLFDKRRGSGHGARPEPSLRFHQAIEGTHQDLQRSRRRDHRQNLPSPLIAGNRPQRRGRAGDRAGRGGGP